MERFFRTLFSPDDHICYGDFKAWQVKKLPNSEVRAEFFCINPLDPEYDHGHEDKEWYRPDRPRRADINVTKMQNFMFEMDSTDLGKQLIILNECGIPWSSIVYSGGKSYHAIVSLIEPLEVTAHTDEAILHYKNIWRRIRARIDECGVGLGFSLPEGRSSFVDGSSINPSRLSRFPGFERSTGKEQKLVKLGTALSPDQFDELIKSCPVVKERARIVEKQDIEHPARSVSRFIDMCSQGLYLQLKRTQWGAEGNYPLLYRLTLWAIDETGVDQNTFLEFAEKYIFTKFTEVGYPKSKWRRAIDDAYSIKSGR